MPFGVVEVQSTGTATQLFAHRNIPEPDSLRPNAKLGLVELRRITAEGARSDIGEDIDVRIEQQPEEVVTRNVRVTHGDDGRARLVTHAFTCIH